MVRKFMIEELWPFQNRSEWSICSYDILGHFVKDNDVSGLVGGKFFDVPRIYVARKKLFAVQFLLVKE